MGELTGKSQFTENPIHRRSRTGVESASSLFRPAGATTEKRLRVVADGYEKATCGPKWLRAVS